MRTLLGRTRRVALGNPRHSRGEFTENCRASNEGCGDAPKQARANSRRARDDLNLRALFAEVLDAELPVCTQNAIRQCG